MFYARSRWGGVIILACVAALAAPPIAATVVSAEDSVSAFYYLWYGEPATDGKWLHWDHAVLPHWHAEQAKQYPHGQRFNPPKSVHSPFMPAILPYSSRNRRIIDIHIKQMLESKVTVMAVSWWGPFWRQGTYDTQGVQTDEIIPLVIERAEMQPPMKVAIHLEPYEGRDITMLREDLIWFMGRFNASPALQRVQGRPVFYAYDSYKIPAKDWATLLCKGGSRSIRGTPLDGYFIALWVEQGDGMQHILPGCFDGFYSYFAADITWGSHPNNWDHMASFADTHGLTFSASIGPGYNDTRIRPWNAAATRAREGGKRFQSLFESAIESGAQAISITSWNEWGEGTQIEPAIPAVDPETSSAYADYGEGGPDLYLRLTRQLAARFKEHLPLREPRLLSPQPLETSSNPDEDDEDPYVDPDDLEGRMDGEERKQQHSSDSGRNNNMNDGRQEEESPADSSTAGPGGAPPTVSRPTSSSSGTGNGGSSSRVGGGDPNSAEEVLVAEPPAVFRKQRGGDVGEGPASNPKRGLRRAADEL